MKKTARVALVKCEDYGRGKLERNLARILEAANITVSRGSRILLKPNLLMKRPLACTSPQLVSALSRWLLDHGAKVTVADSPGFGNVPAIAKAIGLSDELRALGLKAVPLSDSHRLHLELNGRKVALPVSPMVFEHDAVFSVCRIKAHSQMRLTLSIKNCFGMIPGLHKAFVHAFHGDSTEFFASCIASLYSRLPPVTGIADGVTAMHVTGPSKGFPYPLGLLGAALDPVALDLAIMKILHVRPSEIPLAAALNKIEDHSLKDCHYPLEKPESFNATGFILPERLKPVSFNPLRLVKSCVKRVWTAMHE